MLGGRPCDVVAGGASISELASLPLSLLNKFWQRQRQALHLFCCWFAR